MTFPVSAELIEASRSPADIAAAAARTCYARKGPVRPEAIIGDERDVAKRDALLADLHRAGHNTVFAHAHFTFLIHNVSRAALWQFLHAHPFYNSEQVSQRYVAVRGEDSFITPVAHGSDAHAIFEHATHALMDDYDDLCSRLLPTAEQAYFERFPQRRKHADEQTGAIKKKAQEVARYALPIAAKAHLYHTVSAITLMRYAAAAEALGTTGEQRALIEAMTRQVEGVQLPQPLEVEASAEYRALAAQHFDGIDAFARSTLAAQRVGAFRDEFDAALEGRISHLQPGAEGNESLLASAVREVLQLPLSELGDEEAIRLAMDPGMNPYLGRSENTSTLSPLARAMQSVHYTFKKRISHTASSQDQRHRMTPAGLPVLLAGLAGEPDYITPALIEHADDATQRRYHESIERAYEGVHAMLAAGATAEQAQYLLPNAAAVRFTQGTNLLNLQHKAAMRLCLNAQEEIFNATVDEVEQIAQTNPTIARYLQPPCGLRKLSETTPYCPEGARFCGERVWEWDASELRGYERVI